MAGDAVIGALRVVLGADTAKFEDGLKRATNTLNSFVGGLKKGAIGAVSGVIESQMKSIVDSVTGAFESIDKLGKTAQKVGLPVEELSKLSLAAELSDVSMDELAKSLGFLSRNMVEAAAGTEKQSEAFARLGINVKNADGSLKSSTTVLFEMAGAFEKSADGANKTAIAWDLFNRRTGGALIPLLNEGQKQLLEMALAAERMGLVVDKQTANAVQKFNDDLKILQLAQTGLINQIIAGIIPALTRLSGAFAGAALEGSRNKSIAQGVITIFKELAVIMNQLIALNFQLGRGFLAIQEAITAFPDIEKSRKAFQDFRNTITTIPIAMALARHEADQWFSKLDLADKKTTDLGGKTDVLTENIRKFVEGMQESASRITEEVLPANEKYAAELLHIDNLLKLQLITLETHARKSEEIANRFGTSWSKAGASIAGSMAEIADTFGKENQKIAQLAKVFSTAQALISTFAGAAEALKLPFPANLAAAATVLAKGLGFVAAIKAVSFAQGGKFKVPGGLSATDNRLIPMMLASGEQVEVTRPRDQQPTMFNITLQGESVSRNAMRDLFATINSGLRDGYRLKLVE